jgi:hypothetical protein
VPYTVIAEARAHRAEGLRGGYWVLTVARCPLCQGRHIHGGGNEPSPSYGYRAAHCTPGHDYLLVPTGEDE